MQLRVNKLRGQTLNREQNLSIAFLFKKLRMRPNTNEI